MLGGRGDGKNFIYLFKVQPGLATVHVKLDSDFNFYIEMCSFTWFWINSLIITTRRDSWLCTEDKAKYKRMEQELQGHTVSILLFKLIKYANCSNSHTAGYLISDAFQDIVHE